MSVATLVHSLLRPIPHLRKTVSCGCFLAAAAAVAPAQVLLQDDFDNNTLNPAEWKVVTQGVPFATPSVVAENQRVTITNRGHLVTVREFDPNQTALRTTGTWEFGSLGDFLQVLTRSDGIPSGTFGEAQNGLHFLARSGQVAPGDEVVIVVQGSLIALGDPRIQGSVTLAPGAVFDFDILDRGTDVSFTVSSLGLGSRTVTVKVLKDPTETKHIVFHNREGSARGQPRRRIRGRRRAGSHRG